MVPCIILTLAMNWRWARRRLAGRLLLRFSNATTRAFKPLDIEFWNTLMRLAINEDVEVCC